MSQLSSNVRPFTTNGVIGVQQKIVILMESNTVSIFPKFYVLNPKAIIKYSDDNDIYHGKVLVKHPW